MDTRKPAPTESNDSDMPRHVSPLRLSDLLDRYHIDEPIDEVADREQWQDVAARDVLGADDHQHDGLVPGDKSGRDSSSDV